MSTQEKAAARKELEEELSKRLGDEPEVIVRVPRFTKKIDLPMGFQLNRKDNEYLIRFQELPYISPLL
jgi:8-oxo-dGTP pyrophosphatase MutT (NUDIX family)